MSNIPFTRRTLQREIRMLIFTLGNTVHAWPGLTVTHFNERQRKPLTPDSAIWHKMQLHAQNSVNLHEICTTKSSWKDLHLEGVISCPLPIQDLIYHPCNFWNFLSFYFLGQVISDNSQCTESCKLSYSFGTYPICTMNRKILKVFIFFHFGHLSIQSVTSSISIGVIYSITQKIPFKWYITCGLLVHSYWFKRIWLFPRGLKGFNSKPLHSKGKYWYLLGLILDGL